MQKMWAPWRMEYIKNAEKINENCIFCSFPKQQEDRKNLIAYRSDLCFVIMNKYPYNNGHLMVVPYEHHCDLRDLNDDVLLDIQKVMKLCLTALENSMGPHGFNVGLNLGRTAGAGIDQHVHYHIVPRWDGDTNYMPIIGDTKVVSESLDASWLKIHEQLKKLTGK